MHSMFKMTASSAHRLGVSLPGWGGEARHRTIERRQIATLWKVNTPLTPQSTCVCTGMRQKLMTTRVHATRSGENRIGLGTDLLCELLVILLERFRDGQVG